MAFRDSDRVEVSLDGRQMAGLIAGALVTLAAVFATGVAFGHRLAGAPRTVPAADLARLDAQPAPALAPEHFTFPETLAKADPKPAPTPRPPPTVIVVPPPAAKPPPPEPPAEEVVAEPVPPPAPPEPEAVVAVVREPQKAEAKESPKAAEGAWTVQFGASQNRAEADKLAALMVAYGYTSFVQVADIADKGRYYRVRVGRYGDKAEAERLRAEVQARHKLSGVVMPAQ